MAEQVLGQRRSAYAGDEKVCEDAISFLQGTSFHSCLMAAFGA